MKCAQCGREHKRKRFCSNRCKDRWHNARRLPQNPETQHMDGDDEMNDRALSDVSSGWDDHKDWI